MLLFKLALLNIGRNRRRSWITVLAVGVGVAAFIFLWAFENGTAEGMRDNVTRLFTGHVQIHAAGFDQELSPELTIPNREETLAKLKADPQVTAFSERTKCEALVGTSERSRGVLLMGVDPKQEKQITELQNHIVVGEYLSEDGNRELLIGDRLAERLQVELGDKIVVMTQAMDGTLAGYAYRTKGIFHTGSQQVDELTAYITLASGRELLGVASESHEIVIRLGDRKSIPEFITTFRGALKDPNAFEVLAWDEIVPEPELWVQFHHGMMEVFILTLMIVIAVGVMNTILMSVFERAKEFGVMLAIGTEPSQVVKLVLLETLILESLGIIAGFLMGCGVVFYFGTVGISFADLEVALSQSYVSTVTYPMLKLDTIFISVLQLVLITTVIGLYPAWKAERLEPVKAIYHS